MIECPIYMKLWEELSRDKNMVFLAGPRQVGKTTLANRISSNFTNSLYFNWDIVERVSTDFEWPQQDTGNACTAMVVYLVLINMGSSLPFTGDA